MSAHLIASLVVVCVTVIRELLLFVHRSLTDPHGVIILN